MAEFHITFGALCDPIKEQLQAQGLAVSPTASRFIQHRADACVSLHCVGLLTDSEANRVRQRLLKSIRREIENHHRERKPK